MGARLILRRAWIQARDRLSQSGVEDAALESEALLRRVLGLDRAAFFAALDDEISPRQLARLGSLVERREEGEPLAYILGWREFYGIEMLVTPDVFIPRQETELLVDRAIELGAGRPGIAIADVGTGSGAGAVAIAVNLPSCRVYATDVSQAALDVAETNCRMHAVAGRVRLMRGDLLAPITSSMDMIVSNPPYIRSGEIARLGREVRREPAAALDGGPDGLDLMRRLFQQAPAVLKPGGTMLVEIDPSQLRAVMVMAAAFPGAHVSHLRDLSGNPRVMTATLPPPAIEEGETKP